MLYTKNVPGLERALRILAGLMALGMAYWNWGTSNLGVAAGVMGAMLAMTGLIGFCPMCAMVGRKLGKEN